jgi:hypothetical protein
MDLADLMALMGLEFLYDVLEERCGRFVASLVTLSLALVILGFVVWVTLKILHA